MSPTCVAPAGKCGARCGCVCKQVEWGAGGTQPSLLTQWLACAFSAIPLFAHGACRSRQNCTGGETDVVKQERRGFASFGLRFRGVEEKGKSGRSTWIQSDEEIKIYELLNGEELWYFRVSLKISLYWCHFTDFPLPHLSFLSSDGPPYRLFFRVKFYSSEPNNLREEFTR